MCNVDNCDEQARFALDLGADPDPPLLVCHDCAAELAAASDAHADVSRLHQTER